MALFKRYLKAAAAAVCTVLLLCGCGGFDITADDFLAPPRASGEMYDIQQTLEKSISGKYTLKYPTAGRHRSAYILADLTGSGSESFAVAFYSSLNSENLAAMHLNLMKKVDDDWMSISDISMSAIGVEKVEFADLDRDGLKEIVVGWNIYGGVDKRVLVYSLKGLTLNPRIQESYTDFICCDLRESGQNDLLILNHNTAAASASVKLYTFGEDGVRESGSCLLDGTVTSFSEPVLSKLSGGRPAIFIDAVKGNGMQTEIVCYQDGSLVAPLYSGIAEGRSVTYRDTAVASIDINGDGCLDIPFIQEIDNFSLQIDPSTLNPITRWCSYNGREFILSMFALMNYADGYYFEIPDRWLNRITVERETESRLRAVYLWNIEDGRIESELMRIRTVTESEWDKSNNGFSGYTEITRADGVVYAVMISGYEGVEKIDMSEIQSRFHLIG